MDNTSRKIIMIISIMTISLLSVGCKTLDALMGAAGEAAGEFEGRYGDSPYYGGSSLQKMNDAMKALSNLYFDAADFTKEFIRIYSSRNQLEILVKEIVVDTLVQRAYDSLINKNYELRGVIRSNYNQMFIEKIKNKIKYYEYKVRVEELASDFVDVIEAMRAGR